MADQLINIAKSFLIAELKKQIKENEKQFEIVEKGIDTLFILLKAQLEPISTPLITGIKQIPFGDPNERLKELTEELKLKIDGIDFSELEKIPDILPEIKIRIQALPKRVKDKLKTLIDELITGSSAPAEATNPATTVPTTAATTVPTTAEATVPAADLATIPATIPADEVSIKETINTMKPKEKKETINNIIEYLKSTGMFDEIKELMLKKEGVPAVATAEVPVATAEIPVAPAVVAPAVVPPSPPAVGGAKQKRRQKTKKNIYQRSRGRTQYGRKF